MIRTMARGGGRRAAKTELLRSPQGFRTSKRARALKKMRRRRSPDSRTDDTSIGSGKGSAPAARWSQSGGRPVKRYLALKTRAGGLLLTAVLVVLLPVYAAPAGAVGGDGSGSGASDPWGSAPVDALAAAGGEWIQQRRLDAGGEDGSGFGDGDAGGIQAVATGSEVEADAG